MRIYGTADSNQKWGGHGPETKNSWIYALTGMKLIVFAIFERGLNFKCCVVKKRDTIG
jgi:hypothetical protein